MLYVRTLFSLVIVTVVVASFFIPDGPLPGSPELEELAETEVTPEDSQPEKNPSPDEEGPVVCPSLPPDAETFPPETIDESTAAVRLNTEERVLVAKAVQAQTDFAADLYRQLSSNADGGNLFFSPHSIGTILALTADGARGETAKEMLQVLHLQAEVDGTGTPDLRKVQAAIAALQKQLQGRQDRTTLKVANSLWIDAGMPLRKPYVDGVLNADPSATFENVDFRNDFEAARLTINDWAERKTASRIKDLLAPGSITKLTRLVLSNAVYFKGDWAEKFQPTWTRTRSFTIADGSKTQTPMMSGIVSAGFADLNGYSVLDLPYAGEKLSLLVILPDEADGLSSIERKLSLSWLAKGVASLKTTKVQVVLPKFRMETGYSLKRALSEMGMPTAFGEADFTGLTDSSEAALLQITNVEHKAFLEVNEEGSEAAAATAVVIAPRGIAPPRPTFIADRSFAFAIRHRESGQLLFLGRLTQPEPVE